MLLEIKKYLIEKKILSLKDIAQHFQKTPDFMRALLQHFVNKGNLHCRKLKDNCGKCQQCPNDAIEVYEWIENTPKSKRSHNFPKISLYAMIPQK